MPDESGDLRSFRDLFKTLPAGGLTGTSSAVFGPASLDDLFVGPTLRTVQEPASPNVTLISARGATGKSVLARRISASAGVPLWDLGADRGVSADALGARLNAYLGPDGMRQFTRSNTAFVVVDALDEARMRVSAQSWSEFLDSLVEVAGDGHRLVLLGRERILEDVWVHLDDAARACAWYEISHFNPTQRVEYVDRRYAAAGETATAVYAEARDAVIRALAGTVEPSLADSFVGYAPVLDAVVTLLIRDNPIRVLNAFQDGVAAEDRIEVLTVVLNRLLIREQEKVEPTALELSLDPSATYGAAEQIEWLAADLMGGSPPALSWCSAEKRPDYIEKIATFVQDHPFRSEADWASPVFAAFVASRKFGDMQVRDALLRVGQQTGLLFDFVINADEATNLDEWQFAALHRSMLAAEWQDVTAEVAIAPSENSTALDNVPGQLHLAEGSGSRGSRFALALDVEGELRIHGSTAFLSVDFPGRVTVDEHNGSTTLGPDAYISCRDLAVGGESVEIARRPPVTGTFGEVVDADVVLEVSGSVDLPSRLVGAPPADVLEVRVDKDAVLRFPWVDYRQDLPPADAPSDERARRFLNMLMNLLRRHGHDGPMAVFDKKLEGRQSIKQVELRAVLAKLQDLGIVRYEGAMIYLDPEWEGQWFSGKARPGLPSLDDKIDIWTPALAAISAVIAE